MKINELADGTILYRCPCGDTHAIKRGRWTWNGDTERPTFSPSVLVTTGHFIPHGDREKNGCWCTYNAENPDAPLEFGCYRCHSFVKDGQVQFLSDCTHSLAGQTAPLGDW